MHRIDTSTVTPDNKFTEGDPTVPVAATTVSADWLNAVQEELVAAIASAGLEPEKSDNTQLRQAIDQLINAAKPGLASENQPGLVQVGEGLNITPEGLLSVLAASFTQAGIVRLASVLSASTTAVPTCKAVKDAIDSLLSAVNVPVGGILAFSGTFGGTGNRFPIPLGEESPDTRWCLCDGVTTNGKPVPDLRNRMIMCAGATYAAGSTGGAAIHTHTVSGTVDETTLTVAQLAAHDHEVYANHNTSGGVAGGQWGWWALTVKTKETGSSASHMHSLSGIESGSASSLPPYYALAYIMRIA